MNKIKIIDGYGFGVECTPMDELRVIEPVRLTGSTFVGNIVDNNYWTVTNSNGGSTTQANCQVTTRTNTSANGSSILQSYRKSRYIGGSANRYRAQIQLGDSGKLNNSRRWGMFDGTDGAYFKLSGNILSVCTMKTGVETSVEKLNWNGCCDDITLTDVNSYEIYITNAKVYFVIGGHLVHTASFATTTWTDTTNLPVRMDSINSNNSVTDCIIYCRVSTIYRLGSIATQPTSNFQSGTHVGKTLKYGSGNIRGMIIANVLNTSDVILYDNTTGSGTKLFDSGAMSAKTVPDSYPMYDMPFHNGLTLVISGASSDVTVVYE